MRGTGGTQPIQECAGPGCTQRPLDERDGDQESRYPTLAANIQEAASSTSLRFAQNDKRGWGTQTDQLWAFSGRNSLTILTTAWTFSTDVLGTMPWPRLKMWPGRPLAARRISFTRSSRTSRGAKSVMGSRLPCTAWPWPTARQPSSRGCAPVEADDVGSGCGHLRKQGQRSRRRSR